MTREEAIIIIGNLEDKDILFNPCDVQDAKTMAIKALERELSGDLISREETLTAFADYVGSGMSMDDYDALWNIVTKMPSVNPQEPKTGHWITEDMFDGDVAYRCSECNELFWIESGTPKDNEYNFCPKCGAKMIEQKESEDKE